jgi:hypothetical protein
VQAERPTLSLDSRGPLSLNSVGRQTMLRCMQRRMGPGLTCSLQGLVPSLDCPKEDQMDVSHWWDVSLEHTATFQLSMPPY